ncbi:hypothetical protein FO519_007885 [Halicephalobus sp. NKZ332]|nr:hypothetical protein FO519_007885 [Halicephalobus sp. NKZ332]
MNKLTRAFGTWFICHIVGMIMFFICCIKYSTDPRRIAVYVMIVTEVATAILFLFRTFKIIFLIGVPSLLTSRLRTVLIILIITWSIQGSAVNITNNIQSSIEGVFCVQMKVRFLAEEMRNGANSKMIEWQIMVNEKVLGIFEICSEFSRIPYNQCMNKLNDLYYFCLENTFDFVCQPILFLKKQCFVTRVFVPICDWPSKMKKNIQEAVGPYVKDSMKKTFDFTKNTTFYNMIAKGKNITTGTKEIYKTLNVTLKEKYFFEQKINIKMEEFKKKLRSEIAIFESFLFFVISTSNLMIFFVFLTPFLDSVLYITRFNRIEKIDNYFLTEEIKSIDKQRKTRDSNIFPLNEDESDTYIWTFSWKISSNEKLRLTIKIAMTVVGILVPFTLILVDVLTYTIMDTGYEFFHSNYTMISKPSIYQLKASFRHHLCRDNFITGTGFLNSILSNILEAFQPVNSMTEQKDSLWRSCFQEPSPPKYRTFRLMLGLFVLGIFTCFTETYVRRLRHIIAVHFFPERRRPRALFLYKEIQEKRKNILSETIKMAEEKFPKRSENGSDCCDGCEESNSFEMNLPSKMNQCFRCGRADLKLIPNATRICVNCDVLYCVDCFSVSKRCHDCGWPMQNVVEGTDFYVDSESD